MNGYGAAGDLTYWGQLGATGQWAERPIHTYGTPEYSGYGYFMVRNKWSDRTMAPGYESFELAAQIVKRVGEDAYGIVGFGCADSSCAIADCVMPSRSARRTTSRIRPSRAISSA